MLNSIVLALRDIKLHHTVFAMPFAVLGAFLAAGASAHDDSAAAIASAPPIEWRRFGGQLALVVVCMVFARTWAMLFNRIVDRDFDAANPRTASRMIASGALRTRSAMGVALGAALGFAACCSLFWIAFSNPWPALLAIPTLAWIAFYSLTKRFTWASHLFLGGALAASPLAATIAVDPAQLDRPGVWLIALMVLLWVGGFDVLYALQDIAIDRSAGLHSAPERFGAARATWAARTMHALAFGALMGAWMVEPALASLFLFASLVVGALLIAEHVVMAIRGVKALPIAFFTINGVVSVLLGAAGCLDIALR